MDYYRTDDSLFNDVVDYPFHPNYEIINGLRIHYIDEGPKNDTVIMLLHGVPGWSFIYRRIIPFLVEEGYRVIAPDLAGFGKSDKPSNPGWHTLSNHVSVMGQLIGGLHLSNIYLFCQDWGSMIGLKVLAEEPHRFSGVVISNGGLPAGEDKVPLSFRLWKLYARYSIKFSPGYVVNYASIGKLSKAERYGYNAPFPERRSLTGPRTLPGRVPVKKDHPESGLNKATLDFLGNFEKPFLTVFGDSDKVTRGWDKKLQYIVPGAKGQNHRTLKAGHFIQEDAPGELANIIIDFIGDCLSRDIIPV